MRDAHLRLIARSGQNNYVSDLGFRSHERGMSEAPRRRYVEAAELWRGDLKVAGFPAESRPQFERRRQPLRAAMQRRRKAFEIVWPYSWSRTSEYG